jgi:hypothetical protein
VDDVNGSGSYPLNQFGVASADLDPDILVSQIYITVDYYPKRYSLVDETSADDSDYLTSATNSAGGYSLFTAPAFAVPADANIVDVTVTYRARDVSSGTNNIRAALKVGGTVYNTTSNPDSGHDPTTSFTTWTYPYTINPDTGAAWTVEDVNGTGANPLQQFGVGSSDLTPGVTVSMVNITVNYTQGALWSNPGGSNITGRGIPVPRRRSGP